MVSICNECFKLTLPACVESLRVEVGYPNGTLVYWKLKSYKRTYFGSAYVVSGEILLTHSDFSKALFQPFEGVFVLTVLSLNVAPDDEDCGDVVDIPRCGNDYPCGQIRFSTEVPYEPGGCPLPEGVIRHDYSQFLFYIGYGTVSDTDTDPITIKRVTIDPVDGSVVEEYSTNPWTNFADGPWSPTPP